MKRSMLAGFLAAGLCAAHAVRAEEEAAAADPNPCHVRVDVCFVEYSNVVIEPLVREGGLDVAALKELWRKGKGRLAGSTFVVTKAGQEAVTKNVTEYIYPTQFSVSPQVCTNSEPNAAGAGTTAAVVEPGSFQTREIGTILQVVPEVSPNGEQINLTMNPQLVKAPEWRDYGARASSGKFLPRVLGTMEQPFFPVHSVSTSVTVKNGATVLLGGASDSARESTFYAFVTAQLVDSSGQKVVNPDPPKAAGK